MVINLCKTHTVCIENHDILVQNIITKCPYKESEPIASSLSPPALFILTFSELEVNHAIKERNQSVGLL